jgi:predicted ATPase/DNA-binding XRE family transcriptional regulator
MRSRAGTPGTAATATPFSELLRGYRQRAGLSQQELAERAGLSVEGVGALERGSRRHPHPHTVRALTTALGLTSEEGTAFAATVSRVSTGSVATQVASAALFPVMQRGDLPIPPTLIVGREREEAAAVRLLERPGVRLLTLTGPGGIGKTRLAMQIAAGVGDRFGETCFVDLASIRDAALVPSAIVDALGLQEQGARPPLERLIAALAGQRRLLLLDNFEHVAPAAPTVAAVLAHCPRVTLLVTSRAPLRLRGEHEFPVVPLAVPAPERAPLKTDLLGYSAIRLFVERTQAVDPGFVLSSANAPAVAEISRRLDGLPLAIELAAARTRTLPPAALLARLSDRFGLLTEGPVDAPPRQRTLRDAINWSYDLLDPAEQALFRRLAVFVGGFTLEAAEAVGAGGRAVGPSPPERSATPAVLDPVEALTSKSLLRRRDAADADTPRFDLLETIREYGLERLAASGEETTIRDAHAAYFLALAERAAPELVGPAQREWLDRLEADHPNLRAALDWLSERGDVVAALRLAAACSWLWWYRGHFAEGRGKLEALLAQPNVTSYARPWAAAMNGLGMLTHAQGDYAQAAHRFKEAVTTWRRLDDPNRLAEALLMQGLALLYAGDERASSILAESVVISRTIFPAPWLSIGLCSLGVARLRRGDLAGAAVALEEALASSRAQENPMGMAIALMGLGDLAREQGDDARAFSLLQQAMALFRELGEIWSAILCLEYLAATLTRTQPPVAARLLAAATAWRDTAGLPLPPVESPRYARDVAAVEGALGDEAFAAVWAAGRLLTPKQAIAEALANADVD